MGEGNSKGVIPLGPQARKHMHAGRFREPEPESRDPESEFWPLEFESWDTESESSDTESESWDPESVSCDLDVHGQELLPGIPNHVTMGNIVSKLDWKTCNELQMVSRGWRQVVHNRSVYDAKVLSNSTEAFLVLLSYKREGPYPLYPKLILTLYSCRDHYSVRLPPIPSRPRVRVDPDSDYIDCICLKGRVYLWIRRISDKRKQSFVLDLAGRKKWETRKPVDYQDCSHGFGVLDKKTYSHGFGVLDEKIYRFRETSCGVLTPEDPFEGRPLSIKDKVQDLPRTEIYDPLHDAWSLITPTPPVNAVASYVDFAHHLASFSEWAEEKQAADPSKTFLTNGRYESYFSEWKQKQSHECLTSTVDDDSGNGMAPQVYYSHLLSHSFPPSDLKREEVLFFGKNLIKYQEDVLSHPTGAALDMQGYDVQTNLWKHWKSISMDFPSLKDGRTFSINQIAGFAAANNSLWALVLALSRKDEQLGSEYFLVRSVELIGDDSIKLLMWIDAGFQKGRSTYFRGDNALKPIYL